MTIIKIKSLFFCGIGEFLSMYDFTIYAFLAPVFEKLFFPTVASQWRLPLVFSIFFLGFLARPIGAWIFGHYGDTRGNINTLSWTIILIGLPTFLLIFLPVYHSWGWAAPVLLLIFRLTQGVAVGGEFTGSILFLSQLAGSHNGGFICSFSWTGALLGTLSALLSVSFLYQFLSEQTLLMIGWRIPFIFGSIALIIGIYIRFKLARKIDDKSLVMNKEVLPILSVLAEKKKFLYLMAMNAQLAVLSYFTVIYFPVFAVKFLSVSSQFSLRLSIISLTILILIVPIFGIVSDRITSQRLLCFSSGGLILLVAPIFFLFITKTFVSIILGQALLLVLCAMAMAAIPNLMIELNAAKNRYTAISVPYNITYCLLGGSTPLLITLLIHFTGTPFVAIVPLLLTSVITFWVVKRWTIEYALITSADNV